MKRRKRKEKKEKKEKIMRKRKRKRTERKRRRRRRERSMNLASTPGNFPRQCLPRFMLLMLTVVFLPEAPPARKLSTTDGAISAFLGISQVETRMKVDMNTTFGKIIGQESSEALCCNFSHFRN